ncbi:hypothetical protein [Stenotrophomonas maltophilia]|nr:hypothetical protein [Stenotrophomonas maltophilia]
MVAEKALELLKDPLVVSMLGGVLCWGLVYVIFTAPVGKETGDGR